MVGYGPRALTERASPVYRSQSVSTMSVWKEQRAEVWRILDRSQTTVPPWLGLPFEDRIVVSACHYVSGLAQARVVATPPARLDFAGKRVHWGPRVYQPDNMKHRSNKNTCNNMEQLLQHATEEAYETSRSERWQHSLETKVKHFETVLATKL